MKNGDIRWKWLEERGFNILKDPLQYDYMQSLWSPPDVVQAVFCEAKAGTGKTSLAILAGIYEVELGNYNKIIYLRNAVALRELGFLPGEQVDKEKPFLTPLVDVCETIQPGLFEKWSKPHPITKALPKIEAITTAFIRGINWHRAFVIIDEAQSMELVELQTVYTRCSDDCKIVTIGSLRQNDNKIISRYGGLVPFEVYMQHFEGTRVTYHQLETNYRGWFANHADDIMETVKGVN